MQALRTLWDGWTWWFGWNDGRKDMVQAETDKVEKMMSTYRTQKLARLRNMDFFILDNSIRESTVGQIKSHTLENKIAIFDEVKKCGMKHIIVASFSHLTRVDDEFCQYLKDKGEDFSKLYSFSEVTEGLKDGRYDTERVPVSCLKNKKYGLYNTVFEMDLASPECKWGDKWTVEDHLEMLKKRFRWVRENINQKAKILLNFRDFSLVMTQDPGRLLKVVHGLGSMPKEERIFAPVFEDLGDCLPEELGAWTESVRKVMDNCGWTDGNLLVHIHQQWDLQTAAALACLENGATGVWASICDEGAAVGHASSTVTAMNLVRLGNTRILDTYNCVAMRQAARNVTKITTGIDPHPRQVLYGDRSLDMVFGFPLGVVRNFNIPEFFGVKPIQRMSTMASAEMIRDKLVDDFGNCPQFTIKIGQAMKEKILEDLREGRKEEYMSKVGIALLFDRAGGKLTEEMSKAIAEVSVDNERHQRMINDIRKLWDEWDLNDEVQGDDQLQFDSFYHGFMSPYFGCYRCTTTKQALQALDMDSDGYVDWHEFLVYIKWALNEYPDVASADELLDITFQKGLIPAMRDEQMKMQLDE